MSPFITTKNYTEKLADYAHRTSRDAGNSDTLVRSWEAARAVLTAVSINRTG